jgi:limonene 1,2-monooxygenase
MVANRFVQLDHMTRGRAMLGCGPGALVSDAYMMGIQAETQRRRMDESLTAIMALLAGDEPVTMETDWFTLKDARLQLRPYTEPHFPIAVASTLSPAGMISAGKHGVGVLSLGAGLPGGPEGLAKHWAIAEEAAAEAGKTMNRADWRVVVNIHVAEDAEQAIREVQAGERRETVTYFEETLGRPPGRADDPLRAGIKAGTTLIGTPDDVSAGIERLLQQSQGGFGGVLFRAHEWAGRENTRRSYELFARYVMPRFQNQLTSIRESNDWARANRRVLFAPNVAAMAKAYIDAGRPVPPELQVRVDAFEKRAASAD